MTYPTSIDALVNDKATITLIRAIMTELGTTPSGSEATVAARLDALDATLGDGVVTDSRERYYIDSVWEARGDESGARLWIGPATPEPTDIQDGDVRINTTA